MKDIGQASRPKAQDDWQESISKVDALAQVYQIPVPDMRNYISKLTVECFFKHDYKDKKPRGLWKRKKPTEWPACVPFMDPHNKTKDGCKLKKDDLAKMARFLIWQYKKTLGQHVDFQPVDEPIQPSEHQDEIDEEEEDQAHINPSGHAPIDLKQPTEVSGQENNHSKEEIIESIIRGFSKLLYERRDQTDLLYDIKQYMDMKDEDKKDSDHHKFQENLGIVFNIRTYGQNIMDDYTKDVEQLLLVDENGDPIYLHSPKDFEQEEQPLKLDPQAIMKSCTSENVVDLQDSICDITLLNNCKDDLDKLILNNTGGLPNHLPMNLNGLEKVEAYQCGPKKKIHSDNQIPFQLQFCAINSPEKMSEKSTYHIPPDENSMDFDVREGPSIWCSDGTPAMEQVERVKQNGPVEENPVTMDHSYCRSSPKGMELPKSVVEEGNEKMQIE